MSTRPVVHLELHTGDLARASAFYGALCGWRAERVASYTALDLGDGITARAEELGASVLLAPRSGPTGRRAVITSPAAGELAFWQPSGRG